MSSKSIDALHPLLKRKCEDFLESCKLQGLTVRLIFTYRTPAEQDAIYAQGRTKPGKIVTNLKGDKSKHCFTIDGKPAAKAFDFGIFDGATYVTNGSDKRYKQAGTIGKQLGMTWGGDWKSPYDPGHLEIA